MHVRVADTVLFFDVVGSKLAPGHEAMNERPTILVLHGGPGADHSLLRPEFDALADVAQVVYLDHRGNGRSGRSRPERWNIETWADDVRGFCDALGIADPVVLGVSFGGIVGLAYAARHPHHPGKLVLASTTARMALDHVLDAFERIGGEHAREVARRRHEEPTDENLAEYLEVCFPLYTRLPPEPGRLARVRFREDVRAHFARGEQMRFDLRGALSRITCPVLVLAGDLDPITPPPCSEEIVSLIPAELAHLELLPGAGHGLVRDAPERLVELVRAFVRAPS